MLEVILHVGAFGLAGFCVFLALLNRALLLLPDSQRKIPMILAVFMLLVGGGAVLGVLLDPAPWACVPASILVLVGVGELRRLWLRRTYAGTPPINTTPHRVPFTAPVTTTNLAVHRYEISSHKWQGSPLRIVQITDLHVHAGIPLAYFEEVFRTAEALKPHIVVVTGDFITHLKGIPMLREVLRPIGSLATYAVLGNHDYWTDPDAVRKVICEQGLQLLTDETKLLRVGDQEIAVTGHDFPWGTGGDEITSQPKERLHIILSHTPDNIYHAASAGVDLMFAGHNHAGQIRIPFFGAIVVPSIR